MVIATKPFENDIRSVDWAMNGKFIVCADINGFLYLLDPNTLELKDKGASKFTKMPKRQSTYWVEDIKISPDCKSCAFGAHGAASPIEVWSIAYPKFGTSKVINAGLTSALLHLDWSTDSSIALVNSQAYEMKFVNMSAGKNARSSECRDVEFATWTAKLGFPVQGVFPSSDYTDVNTVCRSNS
jgi:microtubule-associated protein-like 6